MIEIILLALLLSSLVHLTVSTKLIQFLFHYMIFQACIDENNDKTSKKSGKNNKKNTDIRMD